MSVPSLRRIYQFSDSYIQVALTSTLRELIRSYRLFNFINPPRMRRRVTVVGSVCLCVCTSVKSNLTSGASVRPESTATYSADNGGQKLCGVFSEAAPLQRSSTPSVERPYVRSAIKVRMRI